MTAPGPGEERSWTAPSPDEVLRALADPERLAVAGALAVGPRTADRLAEASGLAVVRVRRHLGRLASSERALQ
ncbi:MAG TPA: hypothetical protein VGB19_14090 [Actinomycetota bacterium]